jgi:hypothetical protein
MPKPKNANQSEVFEEPLYPKVEPSKLRLESVAAKTPLSEASNVGSM